MNHPATQLLGGGFKGFRVLEEMVRVMSEVGIR